MHKVDPLDMVCWSPEARKADRARQHAAAAREKEEAAMRAHEEAERDAIEAKEHRAARRRAEEASLRRRQEMRVEAAQAREEARAEWQAELAALPPERRLEVEVAEVWRVARVKAARRAELQQERDGVWRGIQQALRPTSTRFDVVTMAPPSLSLEEMLFVEDGAEERAGRGVLLVRGGRGRGGRRASVAQTARRAPRQRSPSVASVSHEPPEVPKPKTAPHPLKSRRVSLGSVAKQATTNPFLPDINKARPGPATSISFEEALAKFPKFKS